MDSVNSATVVDMLVPRRHPRGGRQGGELTGEKAQYRLLSACLAWVLILVGAFVIMYAFGRDVANKGSIEGSYKPFYFSWFNQVGSDAVVECSDSEEDAARCQQVFDASPGYESSMNVDNAKDDDVTLSSSTDKEAKGRGDVNVGPTVPSKAEILNATVNVRLSTSPLSISTQATTSAFQMQASDRQPRSRRDVWSDEFKEYYACIKRKNEEVFSRVPVPLETVLLQQGQSVTLSCDLW